MRQAADAGNKAPYSQAAVLEMDRKWQTDGRGTADESGLLRTAASRFLADIVGHDSIYREILVTDRHGRLVAASNVTSDYYQGDEDWWRESLDGGRGRVVVSDVRRDQSAGSVCVRHLGARAGSVGEDLAGVMKIVADSREMLVGIAGLELGTSGEAMLVRPDGSIVFSRRAYDPKTRFFAAELLRQHLEERQQLKQEPGPLTFTAAGVDEGLDTARRGRARAARPKLSEPDLAGGVVGRARRDRRHSARWSGIS